MCKLLILPVNNIELYSLPVAPNHVSVRLAVMSDLHCRPAGPISDSLLAVGGLRLPPEQHPVQALVDIIRSKGWKADALLVPGDLTNKAAQEGLSQGWDFALEVGRELGAVVIAVLGNHDVDSKRLQPQRDAFYIARNLHPDFPFRGEQQRQSFFSDGFCIIDLAEHVQIVLVNTVIDHDNEETAKRGSFDMARIAKMRGVLRERLHTPLRMAMMHHHPILHTGSYLSSADVIPTGDALLSALRESGCKLVLHGHKHITRLTTVDGVTVFAAGSFSALLMQFSSVTGNTFHLIDVSQDWEGVIRTWVFQLGRGWHPSNSEYTGFPHAAGFGCTQSTSELAKRLVSVFNGKVTESRVRHSDIIAAVPTLRYVTPVQFGELNALLAQQGLEVPDWESGDFTLWKEYEQEC